MVDSADEYVFVNEVFKQSNSETGWIAKLSNVMRYIPHTIANHECKESKSKLLRSEERRVGKECPV